MDTLQTSAPVVGSEITTAEPITLGVPKAQTITVFGNETLRHGDIAIRPTHIIHPTIERPVRLSSSVGLWRYEARTREHWGLLTGGFR